MGVNTVTIPDSCSILHISRSSTLANHFYTSAFHGMKTSVLHLQMADMKLMKKLPPANQTHFSCCTTVLRHMFVLLEMRTCLIFWKEEQSWMLLFHISDPHLIHHLFPGQKTLEAYIKFLTFSHSHRECNVFKSGDFSSIWKQQTFPKNVQWFKGKFSSELRWNGAHYVCNYNISIGNRLCHVFHHQNKFHETNEEVTNAWVSVPSHNKHP